LGAHVFVVTNETFPVVRDRGLVAVLKEDESKTLWEKTKADILSDLCCLRINDRIFFYEVGVGFHGIYEVVSLPFIDESDVKGLGEFENNIISNAPYRALIRPKFYLKNPVSEIRTFGLKSSALELRSIFYKKVLGRGKANTHLFPEEENKLTELLFKANDGVSELNITPYKPKKEQRVFFDLETNDDGELKYEKNLEGWLIQNIDKPESNTKLFLGNIFDIECFANYVPVNIAGGNIDVMIYHIKDVHNNKIRYKITIIELKKGVVNEDAVIEVEQYVKWAGENISGFDVEVIQPVIIGKRISDKAYNRCKFYGINNRKPILIEYESHPDKNFIEFIRKD
jgi:hypothetical protein